MLSSGFLSSCGTLAKKKKKKSVMTTEKISCFLISLLNKTNKHLMGLTHTSGKDTLFFAPTSGMMFPSHRALTRPHQTICSV